MLVERTPLRAFARSRRGARMPWTTASSRTTCAALSTKSRSKSHPEHQKTTITPSTFRQSAFRHASTSTTNSASTPSPNADPSASSLTWDQFLQLRKVRRRYNLVASVLTGVNTGLVGAGYLSTMDLNSLGQMLFGIDPMMALGISTMGAGALGWLIGPFAGNAVFNLTHRKVKNDILLKEKDFFHRIRRHRADISAGGNLQNNPFPDYYGEKIDSVKGYRQWLRDQKKFSKKRQYQGV